MILSNLALVSVMIASLLLMVTCVNGHKDEILTTLNGTPTIEQSSSSKEVKETTTMRVVKKLKKEPVSQIEDSNLNALERAILEEVKKMEKE